jgi:aspartate racemase
MRKLGIIGGMGPRATALLYSRIISLQKVNSDQEYFDVVIWSQPSIPDRTAYILGRINESPAKHIEKAARELAKMGMDVLCVPCLTAHSLFAEIHFTLPVINMFTLTLDALIESNRKKVGLLATEGTYASGAFEKLAQARGIELLVPSRNDREDLMHAIYKRLKLKSGEVVDAFELSAVKSMLDGKVDAIIAGCTELSLLHIDNDIAPLWLDPLELLAQRCVQECES